MADDDSGTFAPAQIAQLLQITEGRIRQLVTDGYIPRASRGRYPLVGAVRGYIRLLKEVADKKDRPNFDEAKLRKITAETEILEMDAEVRRGELVPVEMVGAAWQQIVSEVRTKLLSVPTNLAARVDPDLAAKIEAAASEQIDEALKALTKTEVAYTPPAAEGDQAGKN